MATSHDGTAHLTRNTPVPSRVPEVPAPVALCPQCGKANTADRHYQRGPIDEVLYACPDGHDWLTRWFAPEAVA